MPDVTMPQLGETVTEGTITKWFKAVGDTVAQAYRRLYKLEKVCKAQVLAMSTGQPLALLHEDIVNKVDTPNPQDSHSRVEREDLYFAAMMRVLDRVMPGYAD